MKQKLILTMLLLVVAISCKKDKSTPPDITKGLISYFNFDDNLKDQQGYSNDGKFSGSAITYLSGKYGKALIFNGTNQFVNFKSNSPIISNQISVSCWINSNDPDLKYPIFFHQNNGGSFGFALKDKLVGFYLALPGFDGYFDSSFQLNSWNHIVGVYDGSIIKFYLNGAFKGSVSYTENAAFTGFDDFFQIGYDLNFYWKGSFDELRIYNRAITPEEVTQLYNLK